MDDAAFLSEGFWDAANRDFAAPDQLNYLKVRRVVWSSGRFSTPCLKDQSGYRMVPLELFGDPEGPEQH